MNWRNDYAKISTNQISEILTFRGYNKRDAFHDLINRSIPPIQFWSPRSHWKSIEQIVPSANIPISRVHMLQAIPFPVKTRSSIVSKKKKGGTRE